MLRPILYLSVVTLLVGCGATSPPPYEKEKTPEEREYYQGATGLVQQQKDQNYIMEKQMSEQCEQARLDLAVAESEGQTDTIAHFKSVIEQSCK